jgi:hypothetical protein
VGVRGKPESKDRVFFTPRRQEKYLRLISQGMQPFQAAAAVGVHFTTPSDTIKH